MFDQFQIMHPSWAHYSPLTLLTLEHWPNPKLYHMLVIHQYIMVVMSSKLLLNIGRTPDLILLASFAYCKPVSDNSPLLSPLLRRLNI